MTRISTLAQNQLLLRNNQVIQQRIFERQEQIASGLKSPDFAGLRGDSVPLTTAQSREARADAFLKSNNVTATKLKFVDSALNEVADIAAQFKEDYLDAEGVIDFTQFQEQARGALSRITAILNTRDQNGAFAFAGSRTDVAPVTLDSSTFTVTFNNDQIVEQATVEEGATIDIGVLADDPALSNFIDLLVDVANDAQTLIRGPNGTTPPPPSAPGDGPTNIANNVAAIDAALADIHQLQGTVGIRQKLVEEADARHTAELDVTRAFIGSLKDVDIAEAIIQVNQDQIALESSFTLTGQLRNLSLVNFI